MSWTEGRHDVAIVLAALVDIADQQRDRSAGGLALIDARKDLHLIGLMPLRGEAAAPGGASLQIGAEFFGIECHSRRTTVDDAADGRPVALAEGGDSEELAEGIAGHVIWTSEGNRHSLAR